MRLGPRSRSRLLTPLTRFLLLIFEQVNGRLGRLRLAENDARRPPEQGSSIAGRRTGMRCCRLASTAGLAMDEALRARSLHNARAQPATARPRSPAPPRELCDRSALAPVLHRALVPSAPNLAPAGRRLQPRSRIAASWRAAVSAGWARKGTCRNLDLHPRTESPKQSGWNAGIRG